MDAFICLLSLALLPLAKQSFKSIFDKIEFVCPLFFLGSYHQPEVVTCTSTAVGISLCDTNGSRIGIGLGVIASIARSSPRGQRPRSGSHRESNHRSRIIDLNKPLRTFCHDFGIEFFPRSFLVPNVDRGEIHHAVHGIRIRGDTQNKRGCGLGFCRCQFLGPVWKLFVEFGDFGLALHSAVPRKGSVGYSAHRVASELVFSAVQSSNDLGDRSIFLGVASFVFLVRRSQSKCGWNHPPFIYKIGSQILPGD
mmetsp:Transcript_4308/g.8973  ORF Transcript_4308/g.8973 Transcript_4308/m.8973 type:complete len:252 (-) Transcript_4308:183-938(-)